MFGIDIARCNYVGNGGSFDESFRPWVDTRDRYNCALGRTEDRTYKAEIVDGHRVDGTL